MVRDAHHTLLKGMGVVCVDIQSPSHPVHPHPFALGFRLSLKGPSLSVRVFFIKKIYTFAVGPAALSTLKEDADGLHKLRLGRIFT